MPCDNWRSQLVNVLIIHKLHVIRAWVFCRLNSIQFLVRNAVFYLVFLNCLVTKLLSFE